jgi:cell division protein FtsN
MSKATKTPIWVWVFMLLVLGIFAGFILFLDQKIVSSGNRNNDPVDSTDRPQPTIDFYEVLPQREVEIPVSEEEQEAIDNPAINKETAGKVALQVGSFKSNEEAESLKAQLAFLGLEATIRSAVVDSVTWHRVNVGPFAGNSGLSRAKNLLLENKIRYLQKSVE